MSDVHPPDWMTQVADALDTEVPRAQGMDVVHQWHARTVCPLLADGIADADAVDAVRLLHLRASDGVRSEVTQWTAALEPVMRAVYRQAYPTAVAYETARANAHAYATANGFSRDGAVEFARGYAELSTEATVRSYADANAIATARAVADAFVADDAAAYALTYPYAWARACAEALGGTGALAHGLAAAVQACGR
jgi:hypothetical protein